MAIIDRLERASLRDHLAEMLQTECSSGQLRKLLEHPERGELRAKLADLGWMGVLVPERLGGIDLGLAVLADTYVELGRVLAPVPVLPTQLVADALIHHEAQNAVGEYLSAIASGKLLCSLSPPDRTPALELRNEGDTLNLDGTVEFLLQGAEAGLLLLCAREDSGEERWLLIDVSQDKPELSRYDTVDLTRHFASLHARNWQVPASRLLPVAAAALRERLVNHAALGLACDALGGTEAILALTIEYMKTRTQFDKPIGSFQALKHRVASLKVRLVAVSEIVQAAINQVAAGESANYWSSMAKFMACELYNDTASDAVQLHGGIGFTWEHECQLFLKRSKLNQLLYGDARWHQDRSLKHLPVP